MKKSTANELPIGFGMALAENREALRKYALLSASEQEKYLERARNATSRETMDAIVSEMIHQAPSI